MVSFIFMGRIKIDVKIKDYGLPRKLRKFANLLTNGGLIPAWKSIETILTAANIRMAPILTGRLISNIEAKIHPMGIDSISSAINPRDGYNYAGIQHDGGYASGWAGPHYIEPKLYMTIPLNQSPSYAVPILDARIGKLIAMCGLG